MSVLRRVFSLGLAAAAVGIFMTSCLIDEDETYVRFTWESAEQKYIDAIAVSYDDVEYWYRYIYDPIITNGEIPKNYGSAELPNSFYLDGYSAKNKGRYFSISTGTYTAVCSVWDPVFYEDWDIVANYTIYSNSNGGSNYFEIAFDVYEFLEGNDDYSWDWDVYDNSNTKPMLQKKIGDNVKVFKQKVVEPGASMDVTYYVIRRPKKQ